MGPGSHRLSLSISVSSLGLLLLLPLLPGTLSKPALASLGVAAVPMLPKPLSTCSLFISVLGASTIWGVWRRGS